MLHSAAAPDADEIRRSVNAAHSKRKLSLSFRVLPAY